jgi:hypothetical protein
LNQDKLQETEFFQPLQFQPDAGLAVRWNHSKTQVEEFPFLIWLKDMDLATLDRDTWLFLLQYR